MEGAGQELRDELAEDFGKPVRDHFEMDEQPGMVAIEKELQNRSADIEVQIERAVNEFELLDAAVDQALQVLQQSG